MAINFYATGCSYIAHASFSVSPDPYPSGIPCPALNISNITGTITIYASEVTFDSGYGFPAYVYVNGTQVDYLQSSSVSFSSSGVSNVQVVATRTSSTVKNYVTIQKGTGINRIYYQYTSDGTTYSSSSTNSTLSITADVGTDIVFTSFTFTDATIYGTPITFAEYTSSAHTSLITSWLSSSDNKIRVKSSVRYFVFTPSLIESTYYGRLVLNGNGGTFGSQTAINWPSVGYQGASGTGSALVSIVLPKSTQTSYIPTRDGYTFVGWATSSTATSATYISGDTVSFTARSTYYSSPTEVNLYAVWKQLFTLSYTTTLSGVTNMPSSSSVVSGGAILVSSVIPVKDGYTFKGWAETANGAVKYTGGVSITMTADKTLYAVFEKITLSLFYWNGSDTADAALIATGQPVSNITAARWNSLLAKIKELADACGASFSYTTVSSGDGITAARFNAARTGLVNIRTALGTSTVIPDAQSSGNTVYATLFTGNGSIKSALNALIGVYNNE